VSTDETGSEASFDACKNEGCTSGRPAGPLGECEVCWLYGLPGTPPPPSPISVSGTTITIKRPPWPERVPHREGEL
jgi:hypothetical protein